MKVLQVIDSLALGGAEMLLSNMYAGFRKRGIECEYYLLCSKQTPLEQKLISQGARVHAPLGLSGIAPARVGLAKAFTHI